MPVWLVLGVQSIAKRTLSIFPGVPTIGEASATVLVGGAVVGGIAEQAQSVGVASATAAVAEGGAAVSVGGTVVGVGDSVPQPDNIKLNITKLVNNQTLLFITYLPPVGSNKD